jgi:hypothetical protein
VAISFVEWKAGETIVSGTTLTTPTFAATQAGDVIIFAGFTSVSGGLLSVKTNNNDPGTFGVIGATMCPVNDSVVASPGPYQNFVGIITKPTVGSTSCTLTQAVASQFKVLGVWVVRGMTNPTQDQGVWTPNFTGTLVTSGLTGTLKAAEEFAVGFTLSISGGTSINTSQTGSAGFTYDGTVTNNASGWSHRITNATTAVQTAFNVASGGGDCLCATYRSGPDWEYLGAGTNVETTTTTHTLTEPANVVAGDLLIAVIASRIASTTSITLPSGWALVGESKTNNVVAAATTSEASGMMAYIIRGASAPSYTFTHPTAPSVAIGRVVAYRGADATPLDVGAGTKTATNITAVSVAGLTTAQANELIVEGLCSGRASAFSAFAAVTDPATSSGTNSAQTANPIVGTWQERIDGSTTTGADTALAIADAIRGTAGATGNLTCTATVAGGHAVVAGAFKLFSTGITGTLTVTETADTAAFTGSVYWEGTLDTTETADTAAFTGNVYWDAILAALEDPDTAAFTGAVEWQGTLAAIETADTAAFTGDVLVEGTLDATEAADTAAFTGTAAWEGILDTTETADTAAFTGAVEWQAVLAAVEDPDTASFTGTVEWQAILAAIETADTAAFTGTVEWQAILDATEAADTAAFTGLVLDPITGTLGATEDPDTASIISDVTNFGTFATTEDPDIAAFTGDVFTPGTLDATEGADTAAFTGSVTTVKSYSQVVIIG